MVEIDEAAPTFYYKETCPHSMSLLEILTSYQKTFPSMRHADIAQASPDILGTPAIRMTDGNVYYGDKAFEFVRSLDESKRNTMSKRTSAPPLPVVDVGGGAAGALKPAAESMVSAEAAEADKQRRQTRAIDNMFGQDVIMPRHN